MFGMDFDFEISGVDCMSTHPNRGKVVSICYINGYFFDIMLSS